MGGRLFFLFASTWQGRVTCVRARSPLLPPSFIRLLFACRLPNSGPPGTKTAGDRTPFPLHGVLVIVSYSACATSSYFRVNAQSRCGFLCVCVCLLHTSQYNHDPREGWHHKWRDEADEQ